VAFSVDATCAEVAGDRLSADGFEVFARRTMSGVHRPGNPDRTTMEPVDGQSDGPVDVENIIRGARDQT
jgi:hypothetical protein